MMNAFLFLILCLSWGSTWIAIKVGVEEVPPLFFAGSRFLAAGILILGVASILKGPKETRIARADLWPLTIMSTLVVSVCFALIFWGEQYVSASVTAIIVQGMIPIFLPFFAAMQGYEALTSSRKLSIVLGIVGLGCIFAPGIAIDGSGNASTLLEMAGLIAIVVGTLAYCYGSVYGRPILSRNSAVAVAGWQNLLGGVIVLGASIPLEMPFASSGDYVAILLPQVAFAWVWLVVIGSAVGFVLYIVLLKSWGASKVSPYAFATPIVAIVLDYLLFGRVIGPIEFLGLIVIFAAMGVAFYKPTAKRVAEG
jgi:drug/metabolite transporter (DMT)-like permease